MNDSSTDPYAPPATDPSGIAHRSDDPGSLWRIDGNRLLVRNLASLPDVCIYGFPETEAGSRQSVHFTTLRPWIANLIWIAFVFFVLTDRLDEPPLLFGSFILLVALPRMLGKRVRVLFFRANAAVRWNSPRTFAIAAIIIFIITWSGSITERLSTLPRGLHDLIMMAVIGLMMLVFHFLQAKGPSRAVNVGDGWFELKGVAPAAIARLAEIQQRSSQAANHPL